jgi:hypothetical protein
MDEIEVGFQIHDVPYRRLSVRARANAAIGDRAWTERLVAPLATESAKVLRTRQWALDSRRSTERDVDTR